MKLAKDIPKNFPFRQIAPTTAKQMVKKLAGYLCRPTDKPGAIVESIPLGKYSAMKNSLEQLEKMQKSFIANCPWARTGCFAHPSMPQTCIMTPPVPEPKDSGQEQDG